MRPVPENLGEKCLVSARLVGGRRVPGAAASAMEAVAMSPSSVSSHNLDAASTSDDMPSSQEGLLFSDSLKVLRFSAPHPTQGPEAQSYASPPMDLGDVLAETGLHFSIARPRCRKIWRWVQFWGGD